MGGAPALAAGDGTVRTAETHPAGVGPRGIGAGDFTGDGKPDLVVASEGSEQVGLLRGLGAGKSAPTVNHTLGMPPAALPVGDWNGDGRADVATANGLANHVSLGNGKGAFELAHFGAGELPRGIAAADLDSDGAPDLAVADHASADVRVPGPPRRARPA